MNVLGLGVGGLLIAVGVVAQWLLKKRLQSADKLKRFYMWVAWGFALLGGAVAAPTVQIASVGITSAGAGAVSLAMLLVLGVDLADKRPDWPAFFIVVSAPWFMRATGGQLGEVFDALLAPLAALGHTVLGMVGA